MGEITVPIGPQHPALKEPAGFNVTLMGEKIISLDMRLGYNHRGIEKACEQRSWIQNLYLLERVCGICSHSHTSCYTMSVEEIEGVEVPRRANYIRAIVGELERIHSHLLWLGVAGHEIGFDTLLMYTWRDREIVLDLLALLTGNRVNYGINTLGGVRRDISRDQIEQLLKGMDQLENRTKYYIEVASEEITLIQRLSKVGYLSHEDALALGTIGPTGRASNIDRDTRRDDPYFVYNEVGVNVITNGYGDVYGRTLVRVGELMESYRLVRELIAKMPDGPIAVKIPRKIKPGEAFSRYEAPRGEDCHFVRSNGAMNPERVKVRAPTLANLQSVAKMLENNNLADVPITLAAIDPCFSCTDRAIQISGPDNIRGAELWSWNQLREFGIEHHRNHGIDPSLWNKKLERMIG